jgi:hypothetical protein
MSRRVTWALAAAIASGGSGAWAAEQLTPVPAAKWCVTRGRVAAAADGQARVTEPKMRAVAPNTDGDAAELRFVYQGGSEAEARLASGELRRQIGIKLRAQDGCNVLYVMWRIEPKAQIVVSLKRNPGQRTHAECGARGYRNLKASAGVQPAPPAPGREHRLHAALAGRILRVWADGALAWEGDVGDEPLALHGPVGVRSDNGRFENVELRARAGATATATPARCAGSSDDED